MLENKRNPRKKLERYDIPGHARELTFSCYHRSDYLMDQTVCLFFLEELNQAQRHFKFKLWAYVLMPNHVHLLLFPQDGTQMSTLLQSIKGRTSKRVREHLQSTSLHKYQHYCMGPGGNKRFPKIEDGSVVEFICGKRTTNCQTD